MINLLETEAWPVLSRTLGNLQELWIDPQWRPLAQAIARITDRLVAKQRAATCFVDLPRAHPAKAQLPTVLRFQPTARKRP